jgi:septum formation protein
LYASGAWWRTVGYTFEAAAPTMPSNSSKPNLILASGSPRRRELLDRAGITFIVHPANIDEIRRPGERAIAFALRMAHEKALCVAAIYPNDLVLAADTIVELDNHVVGKPTDADEARRILRMLSARTHRVVTAYALARQGSIRESDAIISQVCFRHLGDGEIERYLATGEPFDKAGAYGIQGMGGDFIVAVDGDRTNVMGLPLAQVIAALARHGIRPIMASTGRHD